MVRQNVQPDISHPVMSARLAAMRPVEAAERGQWFAVTCRCKRRAVIGPNDYGNARVPSVGSPRTLLRCRSCKKKGMASIVPVWR